MPTAHISANKNEFAETVIFPGDPLRAKNLTKKYLTDVKLISDVRNMLAYTGLYKNKKISVMGHGMGIPSCLIYATELLKEYNVKNIIRVGTCGAIQEDISLREIIVAMGACTDSSANRMFYEQHDFAATANFDLMVSFVEQAKQQQTDIKVGNIHTTDMFYTQNTEILKTAKKMGVLAVDMETAGLYAVASKYGAKALSVLTVSDHIFKKIETTSDEREKTFNEMIEVALNTAINI